MTDNRTTELLCKLLEERGEDYTRNDFGITWSYYSDPHTATESMDGTLIVTGLTPEQAIAATLGSDNEYEAKMDALLCRLTNGKWSKTRQYSLEFMDTCISEEFEALYSEEQFSAPVHGTLTAEQVREAVEASTFAETSTIREFNDSSWQAIADELNAALGSGTCEVECFDDGADEGMDGEWISYAPPTWYLSCGHTAQGTEMPNFCPNCGARIRKAVER